MVRILLCTELLRSEVRDSCFQAKMASKIRDIFHALRHTTVKHFHGKHENNRAEITRHLSTGI